MGKPTGFMEYERQDKPAESPKERIKHFREFHTRCKMYGVWRSVLPGRTDDYGDGKWLPSP